MKSFFRYDQKVKGKKKFFKEPPQKKLQTPISKKVVIPHNINLVNLPNSFNCLKNPRKKKADNLGNSETQRVASNNQKKMQKT